MPFTVPLSLVSRGVGRVFQFQLRQGLPLENRSPIGLFFPPVGFVVRGNRIRGIRVRDLLVISYRQPDEVTFAGVGKVRTNFHRGVNLLAFASIAEQVVEQGNFAEQRQLAVMPNRRRSLLLSLP